VGGVVPGLRENGGPTGPTTRHYAVKWQGRMLVIEDGSYTGQAAETGVWAERREVWSLDRAGRLRMEVAIRSSVDPLKTVTLIYRRL
jgi:hypothetical protein